MGQIDGFDIGFSPTSYKFEASYVLLISLPPPVFTDNSYYESKTMS